MGFSIVHTADFHLDRNFSYLPDEKSYKRRKDLLNAFQQVVDFTLENKPDALLISGDTFDKVLPRNPPRVYFMENIRKIKDNGTKIFVIGGNHDVPKGVKDGVMSIETLEAARIANVFKCHDHMNIEHKTIFKGNEKLNIHGMSYNPFFPSDKFINPQLNIKEGYNILMMHGALQGITPIDAEYEEDNPIDSSAISNSNLDYVALGHYHNFGKREYDGTLACYSGSIEKITFAEETDKKCLLYLNIDKSGVTYEKIYLKNRPIETFNLNIDESVTDIDKKIANYLFNNANKELILRLKLKGRINFEKYKTLHKPNLYNDFINNYFWLSILDELELSRHEDLLDLEKIEDDPIKVYRAHMKEIIGKKEGKEKDKYRKALDYGINVLSQVRED
jgi:DNA repair exonuclease SbcCD nuclease subunit